MVNIRVVTNILAPRDRVFDLARSIDAHMASTSKSNERAIDGVVSGLIKMGDQVTWEATHFGVRQQLKIRITEFKYPEMFVDVMVFGAFKSMKHSHQFVEVEGKTEMIDEFSFEAPFGIFGLLAEKLILAKYMRKFLISRNQILKNIAETDEWKIYIIE
ncbi:MAG: SRPBCC family protein [Phycisphaerales bacterium]|nr:SRPBCC family protein [Phycisphaerales bacterium]